MRILGWRAWLAGLGRIGEDRAAARCDRGCGPWRRWRRILRWWSGGIQLHNRLYCAPQCFGRATGQRFAELCECRTSIPPIGHRIPLGLLLLSRGRVTGDQLRQALEAQKTNGRGRIGEWLLALGFASEQEITSALGLQWACPVHPSPPWKDMSAARMLPYRLLESFRMCPIQYVEASRTLYVSFSERIDHAVLYAIQQMLGCHTEPSVVSSRVMDDLLDRVSRERGPGDLLFESWRDPAEMAHIACGYVLKFGADRLAIEACGEYLWARLEAGRDHANLLFRRPPAKSGRTPGLPPPARSPNPLAAEAQVAGSR